MRRLGAGEAGGSSSPTGRAPATTRRRGCCGRSRSACPSSRSSRVMSVTDPRRDRRWRDRRGARALRAAHRRRRGAAASPRGAGRALRRSPPLAAAEHARLGDLRDLPVLLHPREPTLATTTRSSACFATPPSSRGPASRPQLRPRPDPGARGRRVRDRRRVDARRRARGPDLRAARSARRAPRQPARAAARSRAGLGRLLDAAEAVADAFGWRSRGGDAAAG